MIMHSMYAGLILVAFASKLICVKAMGVEMMSAAFNKIVDDGFCFPSDFLFGTATSAYQVEGGWNTTDRSPSIWDEFCRERDDVECANVADDFVHRYPEDVERVSEMNMQMLRFSISWSRVMKWNEKRKIMVPNQEGILFYHMLLNSLKMKGIVPVVTMYHWDLPLKLHTELKPGGWLNSDIVKHFSAYSELLFKEYGHKVKFWATFNEPWTFTLMGYGVGVHAPGLSNSTTNTYVAAHNVLLSHAKSVEIFRSRKAEGMVMNEAEISIVLNCDYGSPLNPENKKDVYSAEKKMQFVLGWFLYPIIYGDYPPLMKLYVRERLPSFTREESSSLRGSYDLFMLNHYSSQLVTDCDSAESNTPCDELPLGWHRDLGVDFSRFPKGATLSGKNEAGHRNCEWFSGWPEGYFEVMKWMNSHDTDRRIMLTENGYCGNDSIQNGDQLKYFQNYLLAVAKALKAGIPVIGYTAWSLMDNYEWGSYAPRFGLFHVKYPKNEGSQSIFIANQTDLERTPRPIVDFMTDLSYSKCFSAPKTSNGKNSNRVIYQLVIFFSLTIVSICVNVCRSRGDYQKI